MSRKKDLLVICKLLEMFVIILTANDKYSVLARENLRQAIQMQLSREQKTFSQFISSFLKSALNFEHFQIKYDSLSWCISEKTDSDKPKTVEIWMAPPLPYLLTTVKEIDLEKISLSDMQIFQTVF